VAITWLPIATTQPPKTQHPNDHGADDCAYRGPGEVPPGSKHGESRQCRDGRQHDAGRVEQSKSCPSSCDAEHRADGAVWRESNALTKGKEDEVGPVRLADVESAPRDRTYHHRTGEDADGHVDTQEAPAECGRPTLLASSLEDRHVAHERVLQAGVAEHEDHLCERLSENHLPELARPKCPSE
jgi:hypothetical protein